MASAADMQTNVHRFRIRRSSISDPHADPSSTLSSAPLPTTKKCSRTFPICTLCANAGSRCSLSTPFDSTAAQTHHLRARVEWLSSFINKHVPVGPTGIASIDTGTDLSSFVDHSRRSNAASDTSQGVLPTTPSLAAPLQRHASSRPFDPLEGVRHVSSHATPPGGNDPLSQPPSIFSSPGRPGLAAAPTIGTPGLPPDAAARRFVDAYFRNVNRAYPFANRDKVLRDLEALGETAMGQRDAGLDRAECLAKEDTESIQVLVLLSLYSLFDPHGASAWSMAGIASRHAMLLGLSRRASEDKSLAAVELELRHRLFWSIFVLDRMMAVSMGLPVALIDDNMDVPLPGLTIEEFASPERQQFASTLQTNRHVIQLRQLEGRILTLIHHRRRSDIASLSQADRRAILHDLRTDIEAWYSSGSLVSPMEADNIPIHNSITWLSARYYHLLILLHYPCHFNSFASSVSATELLRFAQKHLQSTSALLQQRQLPFNRITLCRIFPVGLVLIHGFIACEAEGSPFPARDEIAVVVSILEAFPSGWVNAHKAANIFRQFMTLTTSPPSYGPMHFQTTMLGNGPLNAARESTQAMLRPILTNLLNLMQEVLGKATCYAFHEMPDSRGGFAGVQRLFYLPCPPPRTLAKPWWFPVGSHARGPKEPWITTGVLSKWAFSEREHRSQMRIVTVPWLPDAAADWNALRQSLV
ncbi:STB5 [Verticillium alfalfae VaMs.102]|uniref:STB5 n=1 Tax=Verticillium alfalfae (strain VaMs.102 / ATCC MYA-4576 / FGSC 10136) TaxID=526221 RepID=C9SCN0_VERA1|nr:STB5 [Verticillium alfalfae VaMs.102]EEY16845.1 STB5 [Verticillium alfalfae VaMs.102]